MRAPRLCRCGHRVAHGVACPCERKADVARKARFDKGRPSAAARGYDGDWRELRAEHLLKHPACARCGAKAVEVDHHVPIRIAPARRLDPSNLKSLCLHCHRALKQSADSRTYERT